MPPKPTPTRTKPPTSQAKQTQKHVQAKGAPKKLLSSEDKIKRLFSSLCAQIDGGYFKNALKTCDKILRIDHTDVDALQAKLFLLLQTDQYDSALTLLSTNDCFATRSFEKAYALYRLHREEEANSLLSSLKESSKDQRGVSHLSAQLDYRQGSYQSAFDIYTQLLDTSAVQSEEHVDLLTNLNAAEAHLNFLTTGFLHALDALPASVVNVLESATPPAPPTTTATALASLASGSPAAAVSTTPSAEPGQATKKVRTRRVPKGVIPGVTPPPNPERWLKKSERSSYGHNLGKRRKATGGGATQGSTAEPATSSHSAKASSGKQKKR
ncbi:hypothetical protein BD410DRAFT_707133, partial [Rickenella mellea]